MPYVGTQRIQLLQFFICEDFKAQSQDGYTVKGVRSNLFVPRFPYSLSPYKVVTCWRKDKQFHKEVIEYETADGLKLKSPHMDIEPVSNSVLFRWHTHYFPKNLIIEKETTLWISVYLDGTRQFESYLFIESKSL